MKQEDWDARYRSTDLVWGSDPNRFVAETLADRPAGRALDLACGEGRNAIWLVSRGWAVTAVDYSRVAIERGRQLADAAGLKLDWVQADAGHWQAEPGAFDLVLISYLQVPIDAMRKVLASAAHALRPGGSELFMIGHAVRNLTEGVGGPRDERVLWDPDLLAGMLRDLGLEVVRCEEVLRPAPQGDRAGQAIDVLARANPQGESTAP